MASHLSSSDIQVDSEAFERAALLMLSKVEEDCKNCHYLPAVSTLTSSLFTPLLLACEHSELALQSVCIFATLSISPSLPLTLSPHYLQKSHASVSLCCQSRKQFTWQTWLVGSPSLRWYSLCSTFYSAYVFKPTSSPVTIDAPVSKTPVSQSIGIMLLCLGIWISVDIGTVFQLLAQVSSTTVTSNLLGNTGCILIALGAILICLSAFGGGAVIKERRQCITVVRNLRCGLVGTWWSRLYLSSVCL